MITKSDDLTNIFLHFNDWIWFLVAAMAGFAILSIVCAICCVWSRMIWPWRLKPFLAKSAEDKLAPGVMWFFQLVARHPKDLFVDNVLHSDAELEIRARSENIVELAKNVERKHWWVDFGFVFAAAALVCLVLSVASYVINVASSNVASC